MKFKQCYRSIVAGVSGTVLFVVSELPVGIALAQTSADPDLDTIPQDIPVWSRLELSGEVQHRQMVRYLEQWLRQRLDPQPTELPDLSSLLPEEPPPLAVSEADWSAYRLGAGDSISVVVQPPFQELSTSGSISLQGTLFVPLLGAVPLEGLTLDEAMQKLRRDLNRYVVNPEVEVVLATPRPAQITVTGEVVRPGFFPIAPNAPLVQALLAAGGVTSDADLRQVTISRQFPDDTTVTQTIDLYTPLASGTPAPDLRVRDGDVILIPQRPRGFEDAYDRRLLDRAALRGTQQEPIAITVVGAVARPGYYDLNPVPPPELDTAILAAQGARVSANLRQIVVRRTLGDGSTIDREVDLFSPLLLGDPLPKVLLEDGDVVIVPELTAEEREAYNLELAARSSLAQNQIVVRVLSYPSNSVGRQVLPNGSTLADVLTGVPINAARLSRVAVIRFDEDLGEAVTYYFNGREAILGNPDENPLLQDKDVVVIGRNFIAALGNFLNNFTQPFRDVLGFLLFFDQLSDSADNLFRPTGSNDN